jgi:hypothetical protein
MHHPYLWQTRSDFESEWARSNLQPESEQIAAAIQKNSGNATYVPYPDEGHTI